MKTTPAGPLTKRQQLEEGLKSRLPRIATTTWTVSKEPAADMKPKAKTKASTWKRYLVSFGKVGELEFQSTAVFAKVAPEVGKIIQTGKTAGSRKTVNAVWLLPGKLPELGDIVVAD